MFLYTIDIVLQLTLHLTFQRGVQIDGDCWEWLPLSFQDFELINCIRIHNTQTNIP